MRANLASEETNSAPAQGVIYACGCLLYVLRGKSDFLPGQQPAREVLHRGKLHLLSIFTVNIQEDAKKHQKAAPDVPEEGETQRLDIQMEGRKKTDCTERR